MEISVETVTGLTRKLTVKLPSENINKECDERIKNLAKTAKVDGFRPGKVPQSVLKSKFGDSVRYEVLNKVIDSSLNDALKQEKINPASRPDVHIVTFELDKPLEYTATFEVFPTITFHDINNETIEQIHVTLEDQDIEKSVNNILKQHATWDDVERAAKNDDQIILDFEGFLKGKAFEGGTAKDVPLVLGSKQMIPGFEEQLMGTKAGDEKTLKLEFPKDYFNKELAGQSVEFKVKVHKVSEARLPELNDEFVKQLGIKEGNVDTLKSMLRKTMQRQLDDAIKVKNKSVVINKILERNEIEIPKALIDQEIDFLREQATQYLAETHKTDKKLDLPREMFEEKAKRRVKLGLLMAEIVENNEIKPEPERVREIITSMVGETERSQEMIDWYYADESRLARFQQVALENQVIAKLLESAKVVEKESSFEEAIKPIPE